MSSPAPAIARRFLPQVNEPWREAARYNYVKNHQADIRLSGLREIDEQTSFNRRALAHYRGTPVKVNLTVKFIPAPGRGVITVMVGVIYTTPVDMIVERLLRYVVAAEFEIGNFDNVIEADAASGRLTVPRRLMTMMLGVTIGSLRGMLALRTQLTFLRDYPLPVINISELVARLHEDYSPGEGDTVPLTDLVYE